MYGGRRYRIPLYCGGHAKRWMINVWAEICEKPRCNKQASYGAFGGVKSRCGLHRVAGMIKHGGGLCEVCAGEAVWQKGGVLYCRRCIPGGQGRLLEMSCLRCFGSAPKRKHLCVWCERGTKSRFAALRWWLQEGESQEMVMSWGRLVLVVGDWNWEMRGEWEEELVCVVCVNLDGYVSGDATKCLGMLERMRWFRGVMDWYKGAELEGMGGVKVERMFFDGFLRKERLIDHLERRSGHMLIKGGEN